MAGVIKSVLAAPWKKKFLNQVIKPLHGSGHCESNFYSSMYLGSHPLCRDAMCQARRDPHKNTRQYTIIDMTVRDSAPTTAILSTRSIVNGTSGMIPHETSIIEISMQK